MGISGKKQALATPRNSGRGLRSRLAWVAALFVCLGALAVPATASAWMDIDSPGEYTNDNTPLIKGDAEINFYIGIYSRMGCASLIDGFCVPYFYAYPSAGYTDVELDIYRQLPNLPGNYWCEDVCASFVRDQYVTTPTPPHGGGRPRRAPGPRRRDRGRRDRSTR